MQDTFGNQQTYSINQPDAVFVTIQGSESALAYVEPNFQLSLTIDTAGESSNQSSMVLRFCEYQHG